MSDGLEISDVNFNAVYLRTISERKAIKDYAHLSRSKVVNAWKQANGKTVRNYSKSTKTAKKKSEATKPKKEEDTND